MRIDGYGTKLWFNSKGERYREDAPNGASLPAIIYANGNKYWYKYGLLHREDGPAVEYPNGDKEWCINGELHRTDGPAIEYTNGTKYWYLNGKKYSKKEFEYIISGSKYKIMI